MSFKRNESKREKVIYRTHRTSTVVCMYFVCMLRVHLFDIHIFKFQIEKKITLRIYWLTLVSWILKMQNSKQNISNCENCDNEYSKPQYFMPILKLQPWIKIIYLVTTSSPNNIHCEEYDTFFHLSIGLFLCIVKFCFSFLFAGKSVKEEEQIRQLTLRTTGYIYHSRRIDLYMHIPFNVVLSLYIVDRIVRYVYRGWKKNCGKRNMIAMPNRRTVGVATWI